MLRASPDAAVSPKRPDEDVRWQDEDDGQRKIVALPDHPAWLKSDRGPTMMKEAQEEPESGLVSAPES